MFLFGNDNYPHGSSSLTSLALDSSTDYVAWRFHVSRAVAISQVRIGAFLTVTGSPGDLEVILQDNAAAVPDGSDIGGGSPTATQFTPDSADTTLVTLTNPYTPSAGDYIWVVLRVKSGQTADGSNYWSAPHQQRLMGSASGIAGGCLAKTSTDSGSSWSTPTNVPCGCELYHNDAARVFNECCCCLAVTTASWDSADNPDERGVAWTQPSDWDEDVWGVSFPWRPDGTDADFTIKVYQDNDVVDSEAIDVSVYDVQIATWTAKLHLFTDGPFRVDRGSTGRVMLMATHATSRIWSQKYSFDSAAGRQSTMAFGTFWGSTNNDAGTPADVTDELYTIWPWITPAGGGLLRHPGMTGGINA